MNRTRFFIIGMALAPLALVAAVCGDSTTRIENTGDGAPTGITVTGEGKIQGAPDVAMVQLGVSTLRPTVAEARQQARSAAQSGNYRDAVRRLYLAALLQLAEQDLIAYERSLTDRIFGCGSLVFTTSAEAPVVLHDIPQVEEVGVEVSNLLFGARTR